MKVVSRPYYLENQLKSGFICLFLCLLIVLFSGLIFNSAIAGTAEYWEGLVQINNQQVQVEIKLKKKSSKNRVAPEIHFSTPWNCSISFQDGGFDSSVSNKDFHFGVDKTNGGKCDDFINGFTLLKLMNNSKISIALNSESGKIQYNMQLEKME